MPVEATSSLEGFKQGESDFLGVIMGLEMGLADQREAVTTVQEVESRGRTQW